MLAIRLLPPRGTVKLRQPTLYEQTPSNFLMSRPVHGLDFMTFLVTHGMADSQIRLMAVAALAQGLNVLQRGVHHAHMLTTHPARYLAMQLTGDGVVDFLPGMGEFAHEKNSFNL